MTTSAHDEHEGPEQLDPMEFGSSPDGVRENIQRMQEIFPEVFAEGKVDFDALRETLGDYVDDREERYSFTWHGKSRARHIAQTPSTGTLLPCPEQSVEWDTTQNLFIEGDNLEVLKLLQKSYHRRVKMIYIDPPYNTGKEFIYPDKYQDNLETYLKYTGQTDGQGFKVSANTEADGRYHTNWLNMMYPRLKLARNLLTDDGSIWISIDDNEAANLRSICNEIFGEENFVATFIWQKRTTRENRRVFSFNHDFVLCFARDKDRFQESRNLLPLGDEALSRYSNPDNDPRGDWQSVAITAQAGHATPSQFYTICTPSGREIDPPPGNCWRYNKGKFDEMVAEGRIWFGASGNNVPRKKHFLTEGKDGLTPHTLWLAEEVGTNDSAKRNLVGLFDGGDAYDTPKPVQLVERMLQIATSPGDTVLDFFAGSGTTGEAVWRHRDPGTQSRRFILVQLPEVTEDQRFPTVSDFTRARLAASVKALANNPELSTDESHVDLGFRVLKLSSSNIKTWDADFDSLDESLLNAIENIKPSRSEDDVLYEMLLKYGLDLAIPIESRIVSGKKVYIIGAGALVVCLATGVTLDVVEGIAALRKELKPEVMRVVFRDAGFADDVVKTNTVQILKQAGINDVKSL
ncbi:MAG: site-specific DNA-methyltransferase [Myxococcales bacterium]|nr:MAG: site-specific DNA-methyltransferase [Myxococcales bacterium]